MTISVQANGLTFTFPDGTSTAQIGESLDEYFAKNEQQDSNWTDIAKENGRVLATAAAKAADFIPDVGNSVLSAAAWAGNKLGIGDGSYTPATTFTELEPEWMKPKTELGDIGSSVGGFLISAPDAPAVTAKSLAKGAGALAKAALPKANMELAEIANRMGFKPTAAVVTQSAPAKIAEQVLGNTPLSAGVVRGDIEAERAGLERAYGEMSHDAPDSSQLGYDIQEQLKDRLKEITDGVGVLYERAFRGVPGKLRVTAPASGKLLKANAERFVDDPVLDELFSSKAPGKLAMTSDFSMNGIRHLRSQVGQAMAENNVKAFKDMSEGDKKQLYGALSEDIKSALRRVRPSAGKMWEEADKAYSAAKDAEKAMRGKFITGKDATGVYNSIFGASDKGFKTISKETASDLREYLSPEVWEDVKNEFVRRMGKATAANGGGFSPAEFAKNWEKVEDAVKAEMFSPEDAKKLEDIATYSRAVREMEKHRNFSNTAHTTAMYSLPAAMYLNPVATTAGIGGAAIASRVIASEKFMGWLTSLASEGVLTPELARGLSVMLMEAQPSEKENNGSSN